MSLKSLRKQLRRSARMTAWRVQGEWPLVEDRTDLLNFLIAVRRYRSYLEIGVRNPRGNFARVRAGEKTGVDPAPRGEVDHVMTSDEFFASLDARRTPVSFDLVFVDGLHLAEQVERDVENALAYLSPAGAIVVHDCNPLTREAQSPDYDVPVWNGTVWKAWVKLRSTRSDLALTVVDVDHGCGVITRGRQDPYPHAFTSYDDLDYAFLERDRSAILNLVTAAEFMAAVTDGA